MRRNIDIGQPIYAGITMIDCFDLIIANSAMYKTIFFGHCDDPCIGQKNVISNELVLV